uniref:Uncharacterized protein n=1 Tax=Gasterosteus aculeatus TaxID=69293 RepID=G3NPL2_GASAC
SSETSLLIIVAVEYSSQRSRDYKGFSIITIHTLVSIRIQSEVRVLLCEPTWLKPSFSYSCTAATWVELVSSTTLEKPRSLQKSTTVWVIRRPRPTRRHVGEMTIRNISPCLSSPLCLATTATVPKIRVLPSTSASATQKQSSGRLR